MGQRNLNMKFKEGIVFKSYFGLITVNDVKVSWLDAIEKNLFPSGIIGFILDYRAANLDIEPAGTFEIPAFYRQHLDLFKNKRVAIITENPADIVYPILIRLLDQGYESNPFSTMDAAIQWF